MGTHGRLTSASPYYLWSMRPANRLLQLVSASARGSEIPCLKLKRAAISSNEPPQAAVSCYALRTRTASSRPTTHRRSGYLQAICHGPGRDRTCDLGIKSPLLYQLSYRPFSLQIGMFCLHRISKHMLASPQTRRRGGPATSSTRRLRPPDSGDRHRGARLSQILKVPRLLDGPQDAVVSDRPGGN
jgi:hypothetical protein